MPRLVDKFVGRTPTPRKGMPSAKLSEEEFKARYKQQFVDPAFQPLTASIERIASIAWEAYAESRKSPITRKAGSAFTDPDYDLSVDWIAAHEAVLQAQRRYESDGPATSVDHQWLIAQRAYLSRRNVEELPSRRNRS